MKGKNFVNIACSLDGKIADQDNKVDWLHEIPNPKNIDMGIPAFMEKVDAIVMGRNTYETVLGFGIEWPYKKPVFVLSSSLTEVPEELKGKIEFISGAPQEITNYINNKGYLNLYIDGGLTIQSFLAEDMIDEMTITTMPILLGGGPALFGDLPNARRFKLKASKVFLDEIVQSHYIRKPQA
ncbi:dihydrofolate reductase family protein [Aureibacter tunicatorum]|uniref:Dihydrofolate reductase n=1 Tax=Aureibacter tunicatorum TaxID=866807 RepID=A0AAE3XSH8_9BACT|nr:dihydrofolate reductase family protein [Aureibacter tunicatorum]MDR6241081.1 dihydrofolate reductase [Aureibacter tunicatorum]BDD03859.1 diacylglycerol kinase [Aureibacter tunicatorum]